jgi:hypothetical protein
VSEAAGFMLWLAAAIASAGLVAGALGRLVKQRWPALATPSFIGLGVSVIVVGWVAALHFGGGTPTRCVDVVDGTNGLAIEERSELLARCVATAGRDEIEPAVVMRKHPRLYPFTLR